MPFGLKNMRPTYHRLVNKVFATFIGRTMEVYVDDISNERVKEVNHIQDLEETFKILKHYAIMLNPKNVLLESSPKNS